MKVGRFAATAIVSLFFGGVSHLKADEVIMTNGDKLSGEITTLEDGVLTLVTAAMGEVEIPIASISTMSTITPVTLEFLDGTVVTQRIQASDAGRIAIPEDEVLEAQSFPVSALSRINPPPFELPVWTGSIAASLSWSAGNSDTRTGAIDIEASRRSEIDRMIFDASYHGGRQRNPSTGEFSTTERRTAGALKYDYFFTEQFYGWSKLSAEKDAVAALDLRLIAGAGIGYQWWETKKSQLSTDAGLTWLSDNYSDATGDEDSLAARLAYRYFNNLNDKVKLINQVEWYPSLEDSKDHFVTGFIALRANLSPSMFGVARANIDWDSTPADNAERTDVLYTLGVGWSF